LKIVPSCFASNSGISDDEMLEFLEIDCKSSAKAELEMWRTYFKDKEVLPQSALEFANPMIFRNVRKMLIHIMVLPITSCEAEQSFSALRRITFLRTTMGNDKLNGLALLNMHSGTQCIPSVYIGCKSRASFEKTSITRVYTETADFLLYRIKATCNVCTDIMIVKC